MSFTDFDGGFSQAGKIRRNSVPYAQHGVRPASERLAEELLRTRPIGELQRNTTQSATSVDLAGHLLRNASSGASITFRDSRTNPHRSSSTTTTSSSSRIIRPYVTHYSDSGFSSTLSSGSSCYLPPPPPYRFRSGTTGSDGLSESASTPKLITLSAGAIRIGGGPLPPELCSSMLSSDYQSITPTTSQFDQNAFPQLVAAYQQSSQGLGEFLTDDNYQRPSPQQSTHRIHRSLSDSKYGQQMESGQRMMGRLLNSESQNSSILPPINLQQASTKIGSSDPYVGKRGSSWTNSQMSLSPSPSMLSTVSCPEYPELQEKLRRLAITRDTLSLQVAVLHDQVGAQKEKIRDLETQLDSKRKLYSYEALTNQPSTQKTDLFNEITDLKQKFQMVQREKLQAETRLKTSQAEIESLTNSIQTLMSQHNVPAQRLLNGTVDENQEMEQLRQIVQKLMVDNEKKKLEITTLRSQLSRGSPVSRLNGYLSDENGVIRDLGGTPEHRSTPTSADSNQNAHKRSNGASPSTTPQPFDINSQLRKLLVDDVKENMAHSSSFPASLCLGTNQQQFQHQHTGSFAPPTSSSRSQIPPSASYLSSLSAGAAPLNGSGQQNSWITPRNQLHHTTSLFAQPTHSQAFADGIHGPSSPAARQLAAELDEIRRVGGDSQMLLPQNNLFTTTSLPRTLHTKSTSALSLPRSNKLSLANNGASSSTIGGEFLYLPPTPSHRRGSSVLESTINGETGSSLKGQRNFLRRWLGRSARNLHLIGTGNSDKQGKKIGLRSKSVPNLNPQHSNAVFLDLDSDTTPPTTNSNKSEQTESDDELSRGRIPSNATSNGKFKRGRGRSTLRNIFGKLTRSTSQEIRASNFSRGNGIRSSASARVVSLGAPLTGNIPIRPQVNQFCDWSTEVVCEWLAEIGFGQYIPEAEKTVRSGRHLLNMSNSELEKDFGIKNLLHRKKLRCLLNCIERNTSNTMEPADRLDVHQTMLWVDDIGLPQLRDIFAENMIDGQMLLALTVQDLVEMKIVSAMNHATIARGIQFLRSVDFNTHRLVKTYTGDISQLSQCPEEVEKWSHSCVIQWLKSIDLAEFTPNLMFSGVHGALIVHDPTFTAESLAEVLQIPAHKTLLRRHLTTHFNNILGQEIISCKRELLTQPHVTFLSPALRIRLVRKGFSLARKRDKNIVYAEPDFPVCPLDVSPLLSSSRSNSSFLDTSNV